MFILEIPNSKDREETLLRLINTIYEKTFNDIQSSRSIPDFSYLSESKYTKTAKIGVQDVLDFKKRLWIQSVSGTKLAIINNAHNLTAESQNALLKDLEEEPLDTIIMLSLPDRRMLLPTVLSRGILVKGDEIHIIHPSLSKEKFGDLVYNGLVNNSNLDYIKDFLSLSLFDQFSYIHKNIEGKKDSTKEKISVVSGKEDLVESFLLDLLSYYDNLLYTNEEFSENVRLIEAGLKKIRKGVNAKAVLEHIILTLKHG